MQTSEDIIVLSPGFETSLKIEETYPNNESIIFVFIIFIKINFEYH